MKYRAFISYSHADEAWAAWLQQALERYRPPRPLAKWLTASGRSARLSPVFRDRDDLPAAGSLSEAIRAAIAESEHQIVVCSPAAARSRWVAEEIKLFHRLHGPGRTFALVVAGDPGASARAGGENEECFPEALRFEFDAAGALTDSPAEPLAADATAGGDGRRYALLKIAAGMLGVGLDDLVRRDAQRRTRRAWSATGASAAAAAAAIALALFANAKQREASVMRGKAEDLVEFMLTELKDRLEPVGRLDVLESVGDRALAYYADQDLRRLDDAALSRRAKALILVGAIDQRRNDIASALDAFRAGEKATFELLRRSPAEFGRVFDHAQSVFYVGAAAMALRDLATAETQYNEYLRLAERLIELDADDPGARLELAYATSNLGILKYEAGEFDAAIERFEASAEARRTLAEQSPGDDKLRYAHAYSLSWLALGELARADYRAAIELIRRQLALYGETAGPQSQDFSILDAVVTAERRIAEAHFGLGEIERSRTALAAAAATSDRLLARDADNANWNVNASHIARLQSQLFALDGDVDAARAAAARAIERASAACRYEACDAWMREALGLAIAQQLSVGGTADSRSLRRFIEEAIATRAVGGAAFIGPAALALVRFERRAGNLEAASALQSVAIGALSAHVDRLPATARIALAGLHLEAGDARSAEALIEALRAQGVRRPDFLELEQQARQAANN